MNNFDEYKRLGEPDKAEKAAIWEVAIGLQDTDGLKVSDYLISTAKKHIDGDITIGEVHKQIDEYYRTQDGRTRGDRTEEADKVAGRVTEILAEKTFAFSPVELIAIHKRMFDGIYKLAGIVRDYNITKKELVLGGDTVLYVSADTILATLEYDFDKEQKFDYSKLSKRETVEHIARFISGIWQIHPFCEGNTRTTAVFAVKYLRKLGFNVDNELFINNSWYFRNALVRANYTNLQKGIYATYEFLDRFFASLLLDENHPLKNRTMRLEIGTVNTAADTVNIVNDTVNGRIDTVNIGNDTVNDTVKGVIGTVNVENDTVNERNDTVNTENDTVNLHGDTVNEENDTVNDTVFNLVKENNSITANEIAQILGIGIATAKRRIKSLKDNGAIERMGSDKKGSWKILAK